jgi:choline dehydrogenase-like flavoprotein
MVGKNLMFHPWGRVEGTFEEMLHSHLGPQGSCVLSHEFYETDQRRGFLRGYTLQVVRGQPPVNIAKDGFLRGTIPWGTHHHDSFQKYYGKQIQIEVCCEDLPETSNTVTLDSNLKDCHGIPAPKIYYKLSDNSEKMLGHGIEQAKIALKEAGAIEIFSHGQVRESGWHNMGTARMGLDPNQSVVNEWGQSHDVKNLFIIDGSIFVTSGAVNPTTTIQALALYVSEQIKNNITNIFA